MNIGAKILSWILTPLCLALIVVTLLVWHPLLALSRFLNARLHRWFVEVGNLLLITHLRVVGGAVSAEWSPAAPAHGPVLLVCNHQSFFDIPIVIWKLRRYYPKFVAKQSLGRGFPSVSYVLRTGGSALIDRGNPRQAVPAIAALGRLATARGVAACIFPEGTRARDGVLKSFKPAGLRALLDTMPGVPVLPVAISGAWQLMRFNLKPIPFGVHVRVSVLDPIPQGELSTEELLERCEEAIRSELRRLSALDAESSR